MKKYEEFKTYYKPAKQKKAVWYWHKGRRIDEWHRLDGPEINPNVSMLLWSPDFWQGCQDHSMGERIVFKNVAGTTG